MAKKRTSGRFTTRYKIFLAVSITAIVLLLLCNIYLYVSRERALAKDQAKGPYPFAALEPMEEKENPQVSLYFYKQLSGEEQEAYDAIERVVSAAADTDVSAYYGKGAKGGIGQLPFALPGEAGEKIVQALRSDHPEYFYWKDSRFDRDEEGNALFIGEFLADGKRRGEMAEELTAAMEEALSQINEASDYATEQKVQEYLARHCERDQVTREALEHNYRVKQQQTEKGEAKDYEELTDAMQLSRTAYGALVVGKASDEGYAAAAQLLLEKCGIPAIQARGACACWNIVWIGGNACHLDVYGDDCGQIADYTYFNLDESIEDNAYYQLDRTYFTYPACQSRAAGYYIRQGTYFEEYDSRDVLWAIGTLAAEEDVIYLKFSEKAFARALVVLKRKNLFTKYVKPYCTKEVQSAWESYYLASNEAFGTVLLYKGETSPFEE